jgi:hypothetical protein
MGGHSDGLSRDSLAGLGSICAWGTVEECCLFWQTHNPIATMIVTIAMMANEASFFLCKKAMGDDVYSAAEFKSVVI